MQPPYNSIDRRRFATRAPGVALGALWTVLRLPVLALLVVFEPVVRLLLGGLALLLVLTALFLQAVSSRAVPFWGMLAVAVGCVALLALYQGLVRLLSA